MRLFDKVFVPIVPGDRTGKIVRRKYSCGLHVARSSLGFTDAVDVGIVVVGVGVTVGVATTGAVVAAAVVDVSFGAVVAAALAFRLAVARPIK
jgi:hypothetical protein